MQQHPKLDDLEQDPPSSPRFSVGVIADIQYAPIPDGFSFTGNPRYYRHSLDVTRVAAQHFEREKATLVLNLGDIVDGKCQDIPGHGGDAVPEGIDPGHSSVEAVLEALQSYTHGPILHTYGNHCLYNLDRETLASKVGVVFVQEPCGDLVGYHSYLHDSIRFVVVDSYDVAILRRCPETSDKRKRAHQLLVQQNPNFPVQENSPDGLDGTNKRYVAFNGGVGPRQLTWLRDTLHEARTQGERVVILTHQPILPGSTNPVCLIWNYDEVLTVLREFPDVVAASFSGHAHKGGYKRDEESGIHFRVFEAALENFPEKTFAMVDFFDDRLVIRGMGNCESAIYDFQHMSVSSSLSEPFVPMEHSNKET
jgi:manganese-dependent ADP-ribose/CDP-alcohol diphosphatase